MPVRGWIRTAAGPTPGASIRTVDRLTVLETGPLYGAIGGVLLALLKFIEYQYLIRVYPTGGVWGHRCALSSPRSGFTSGHGSRGIKKSSSSKKSAARSSRTRRSGKELGHHAARIRDPPTHRRGAEQREIGERLFVSEYGQDPLLPPLRQDERQPAVQAVQKGGSSASSRERRQKAEVPTTTTTGGRWFLPSAFCPLFPGQRKGDSRKITRKQDDSASSATLPCRKKRGLIR
jgi:hypothetical protein